MYVHKVVRDFVCMSVLGCDSSRDLAARTPDASSNRLCESNDLDSVTLTFS